MCALLLSAATMRADEGMWLLPLIQKMNAEALKERGCRLTPEQIYSINNTSLKDAVVHFGGGCTGEIISDQGLLVTNHHCGYSYIQALSTPEHNYLENGWWAMKSSEEMPAEGLSVTFLQSFRIHFLDERQKPHSLIRAHCSRTQQQGAHCNQQTFLHILLLSSS